MNALETLRIVGYILVGVGLIGMLVCTISIIINDKKIKDLDKQIKDLNDRTKNKSYQDKFWSWFIEDASKFIYKGWNEYEDGKLVHEWSYGHYDIIVWLPKDGKGIAKSTVFTNGYDFDGDKILKIGVCVLSSFNDYRSKQLASILLRGLWKKKLYVYGNKY